MSNPLLDQQYDVDFNNLEGPNRVIVPFLACGDLSGFDSDMTYPLELEAGKSTYSYLEPAQSPINPPYKDACELRRSDKLSKPSLPGSGNLQAKTLPDSGLKTQVLPGTVSCQLDGVQNAGSGRSSPVNGCSMGAVGGIPTDAVCSVTEATESQLRDASFPIFAGIPIFLQFPLTRKAGKLEKL
ncbi:tRNA (cytidine(32)/guanosine(34)-2'-O)-methyltransferase [Elysia marginata]|uniref:tRNA (Cytidine(32)/guanosine(34)-2'-O)-methyltransferase n=1 Tax=Elysia marginata TaxID=1093978 RepID=A0AAV4E9P7_9GAST|nr:tRNA (cytidine(32)/guanosine(34)-2'-O)-methyltransferase [Elysia marginata]